MSEFPPEELPAHDKLADADDALGWDVMVHGRMREYATDADGVPETVVLED